MGRARKPQHKMDSLLAVSKGLKYLLAGQTECKIVLKLKRSTEIRDLSSRRTGGL